MSTKSDWEIQQLVRSGLYADSDAVLRSALHALFALHPEQKLSMICTAYRAGEISLGRAAELMGTSSEEMKDLLRQQQVSIHLGPETAEELAQEVAAFESR
jgi:predicted HTH domain antitoxin